MRPSCPPPRMPIVAGGRIDVVTAGRPDVRVGEHRRRCARRATRAAARAPPGAAAATMAAASSAALAAPGSPMASVPTGTPFGICTMESSASTPLSAVAGIGTPSTGTSRLGGDHAGQVRRAARRGDDDLEPARLRPCAAYSNIQSGVRCAETTRTSCGISSSASSSTARGHDPQVAAAPHDHADPRRGIERWRLGRVCHSVVAERSGRKIALGERPVRRCESRPPGVTGAKGGSSSWEQASHPPRRLR